MATKVISTKGREFFVEVEDGVIYIATPAMISRIAAQMIVHEAVSSTKMKSSKTWMNVCGDNDEILLGVGYKIPMLSTPEKALAKVTQAIQQYAF